MEIKSTLTNSRGQVLDVIYKDIESELEIEGKNISGVHVHCFYKDKLVVVYAESKGYWGPPGGGVEKGESVKNSDPDGDVTEVKLIDPKDYKIYFDWGIVGDRLMGWIILIKLISAY